MTLYAEILTHYAISPEDVDDVNVLMGQLESATQPCAEFVPLKPEDVVRTARGALFSVCRDPAHLRGRPACGKIVAMGTFSYLHTLRETTGMFGNVVTLREYRKTGVADLVTRELVRACKSLDIARGLLRADPAEFEHWRRIAEKRANPFDEITDKWAWYGIVN